MNVLSVDDVPLIRKMVGQAVEALDGNLEEAGNGLEALKILESKNGNFDLILLDWNMPGMDGFEFLQKVKTTDKFKNIPVIMTTTVNEKDKIIKAIQAGASHYIIKPFTVQELTKRIMECTGSTHPFTKYFSYAVRDFLTAGTGLQLLESDIIKKGEVKFSAEEEYCWQLLINGQKNALAFVTMSKKAACLLLRKKGAAAEAVPSDEELIEEMSPQLKALAEKLKATLKSRAEILTPMAFSGLVNGIRLQAENSVDVVCKKYYTEEIEFYLYLFLL